MILPHQMNQYLEKFILENFSRPGKALDLGFGKGYDLAYLRYLGWDCQGVDKSTGANLENIYDSPEKPFDLVYSNYVIHKLKQPENLLQTAYNNLQPGGCFFLRTFDETEDNHFCARLKDRMQRVGSQNLQSTGFDHFDNEPGHHHWHKICQITATK